MDPHSPEALAATLLLAYDTYVGEFHAITRRAPQRFETRDWPGSVADGLARLRLYKRHIDATADLCEVTFGASVQSAPFWEQARVCCRAILESRYDADLAIMFVDSVMRRELLDTPVPYGSDPEEQRLDAAVQHELLRSYDAAGPSTLPATVERLLLDCGFRAPYRDVAQDAALCAEAIAESVGRRDLRIDLLRPLFYRNKGAYIVGRVIAGDDVFPLALALSHAPEGIFVDAVLTEESDLRRIFSYTRSNFHVELDRQYREMLEFLRSLMPHKNWAALHSSIGFMNPAKIQLSKDLEAHRQKPGTRLTAAWGIPGLVMVVFTSPGFPYVFKVIRDDDKVTKLHYVGSAGVAERYRLVQEGDRVGRLLDTITFHHLRFRRDDFEPQILRELLETASGSVRELGEEIVITRCYAQRDAVPLPIYLHQSDWPEIERVLGDLGWCLKQIAAAGLFTGEFDLKNFGVAEDGRVVFFDFDGLDELRHFSFDRVPLAASLGQEECFEYLLNVHRANLIDVFRQLHPDLFDPEYWRRIQALLGEGEVLDTFPYPAHKRLETRRATRPRRTFAIPSLVDAELARLGIKSAYRQGRVSWSVPGRDLAIGRTSLDALSPLQRAAVRQTFGFTDGAGGESAVAVIVIDGAPAFVYVPDLSRTVLDLSVAYGLDAAVALEWRERAGSVLRDRRYLLRPLARQLV